MGTKNRRRTVQRGQRRIGRWCVGDCSDDVLRRTWHWHEERKSSTTEFPLGAGTPGSRGATVPRLGAGPAEPTTRSRPEPALARARHQPEVTSAGARVQGRLDQAASASLILATLSTTSARSRSAKKKTALGGSAPRGPCVSHAGAIPAPRIVAFPSPAAITRSPSPGHPGEPPKSRHSTPAFGVLSTHARPRGAAAFPRSRTCLNRLRSSAT
jgi:hypothetical protein